MDSEVGAMNLGPFDNLCEGAAGLSFLVKEAKEKIDSLANDG